ncbi:hypothetical protein T4E_11988 [Trichinella pseudospiralis]|uniref:Retroviral polymerase SH3-like domain-containing protein n=1 Tax=Trichinella pseudospiralis TaxID=6337 RepID=A0A0V0XQ43_TRIPS|nr:hypothetical protein T4E_11988 [Trichinella pseudospiralis]
MNQALVEKARTMLIHANLSPELWAEAVGTANCLRNRCSTRKGYRTMDRKTKKMYVTRKVKFLRSRFPATQASKEESTNPLLNPDVGEEAVIV